MAKLVRAVHDDVVLRDEVHGVLRVDGELVGNDVDVRVVAVEGLNRRLDLRHTDRLAVVQDLALEVAQVDHVEVHEPDGADSGEGEVERNRAAEATRADDEHLRVHQLALPSAANLRHDDVSAVPLDLFRRQLGGGYRHLSSSRS